MCLYKWHWTWNNSLTPSPWMRSILVLTSLILSFIYFSMRSNCVLIYKLVVDYCCISMYSTLVPNSLQDKWELDRNVVLGGSGAFPVGAVLTYNSTNAREPGPTIEEEQWVRFARKAYLQKWVRNWWEPSNACWRVRTKEINEGLSLREREKLWYYGWIGAQFIKGQIRVR